MKGIFISFEGIEGSGKSTQIKMLNEHIVACGRKTVLTREPGGTEIGEKIRLILLDSSHTNMSPRAELFLYEASRNQHLFEVIQPALKRGDIVLCDRYADATTAYQGAARKISGEVIEEAHRIATESLMPDVTFLLDLPAENGLHRARSRNADDPDMATQDRFENEKIEFHKRVRQGYLDLAKREPSRVRIIDATQDISNIYKDILSEVSKLGI